MVTAVRIVIPVGFLVVCFAHPRGRDLKQRRMVLLTTGLCIVPWVAYEGFLWAAGSTPVTEHQVFEHILAKPRSEGLIGYLRYLSDRFFRVALGYCAFFVYPLLALR
ncbi:MAG: hypothetical protein FJY85_08105 [Deltaproteobacteria bacterium]|nr:hypothetical protein [Deltaproteobacteria bacterium]